MEYTPNYNLKKPGDQDNVLVGDLNENMDTVDATMKALSDGKANLDPDTGKVEESELPEFLKLIGGTMKGAINMAGFPVSGLVDPTEDDQAVRKGYVDKEVATKVMMKTGTYIGNGNSSLSIEIGFKPSAFICFCASFRLYSSLGDFAFFFGYPVDSSDGSYDTQEVTATSSGVKLAGNFGTPAMNWEGKTYNWVAWK